MRLPHLPARALTFQRHGLCPTRQLLRVYLQKELQAQLPQAITKGTVDPIGIIPQHRRSRHLIHNGVPNQLQGNFRFRRESYFCRHARRPAALPVLRPLFRQIQTGADGHRHLAVRHRELYVHLAIGRLALGPAILMRHPHRMLSLFEPAGFIDNPTPQRFQVRRDYLTKGYLLGYYTTTAGVVALSG